MSLCIAIEMIIAFHYNLRMFGIQVVEPAKMFCDNEAVDIWESLPESTLKKNHLSISYHRIRESVAEGIILDFKEDSSSNLYDLFTKPLNHVYRKRLLSYIFG